MRPRKRFGQHFLHDTRVLQQIASAVHLRPDDLLMEIGPGQGALTEYLYPANVARYVAVEIDRDLAPRLNARYPNMEVINSDILRLDLASVLNSSEQAHPPWRLVGNLPYNISSPLILKLVDHVIANPGSIQDMHFMLQKEMANRLSAVPGSKAWGRISVMAQIAMNVDYLFDVGPESFRPPPKVDSSIIRIRPLATPKLTVPKARLDQILRLAFAGRRKRLSNALKALQLDWLALDLDPSLRADDVSIEKFLAIAHWVDAREDAI